MILPHEIIGNILFQFTKYNMHDINLLYSVSGIFLEIMKNDVCKKWDKIMNLKIDILVTIAEFIERSDDDSIPYLWGPLLITDFKYLDIHTIIPKFSYGLDRYNSRRLFNSVILSNIEMGMHFGPGLMGIDINYFCKVKYYKNIDDELICNNENDTQSINPNPNRLGGRCHNLISSTRVEDTNGCDIRLSNEETIGKYWIYIFEELCHYCKSYSYIILPYYNKCIKSIEGSLLYDVYEILYNIPLEIEEPYDYVDVNSFGE